MVYEHIIHHDGPFLLHITISVKQSIIIDMVNMPGKHMNMLIMGIGKVSKM
jgi:hypothetical protein